MMSQTRTNEHRQTRRGFRVAALVWAALIALTSICPSKYTEPVMLWLIGGGAVVVGIAAGVLGVVGYLLYSTGIVKRN